MKRSLPSNSHNNDVVHAKVKSPRHHKTQNETTRVCIKVPSKTDNKLERSIYDKFEPATTRREQWIDHVLGKEGVYCGRPQNDGGWYQVKRVKQGSFLANPFHVKDYGLNKSLELYEDYLRTRLDKSCTIEKLIALLPEKDQKSALRYYLNHQANQHHPHRSKEEGSSMKHFELNVYGDEFKRRLMSLSGKKLGCFCDLSQPCHVNVLIKVIHELLS